MKAAAVALLSFTLAGCAPAARTVQARNPASPVSQWVGEEGASDEMATPAPEDAAGERLAEARAALLAALPAGTAGGGASGEPLALGGLEPDVIHRARIEMARAALVEENQNKERVDLAEELQRELAALQASQTSKSRGRRGGTRKQP